MGDGDVFSSQGRIHNKAWSVHIDTWAHTQSPLPGHFALKRAAKLMRVQSLITLETGEGGERDSEKEGEVKKRKGKEIGKRQREGAERGKENGKNGERERQEEGKTEMRRDKMSE